MEVRAKIPVAQGAWPAIWSTGNWWEWPLGGEIDMLEFYKEKYMLMYVGAETPVGRVLGIQKLPYHELHFQR